jgi:hypothetical protein
MPIAAAFSPHTLTVLCTYQCTAACKQCCFESSPRIKGRLPKIIIISRINEAISTFPNLSVVVFSGGEAFMLREDLFECIAHCTSKGLMTRVVSNGYWGKSADSARRIAMSLSQSGLKELNLSTGKDHQEWVAVESVINAAKAVAQQGIYCLITVESEGKDRKILNHILESDLLSDYLNSRRISVQSNSWMAFNDEAEERHQTIDLSELRKGCNQIFGTVAVTPHDNLSACCGLTLEHIPEMRLGKNNGSNMEQLYAAQIDDMLKMWIRIDGPYSIIERLMGSESSDHLAGVVHICDACVRLHKSRQIREALVTRQDEFAAEVITRFHIDTALRERAARRNH